MMIDASMSRDDHKSKSLQRRLEISQCEGGVEMLLPRSHSLDMHVPVAIWAEHTDSI